MDIRTDGWSYVRKISPFYRTSFPIGAAALPPPMKTKEKVEQGKGTADYLMPLGYLLSVLEKIGRGEIQCVDDLCPLNLARSKMRKVKAAKRANRKEMSTHFIHQSSKNAMYRAGLFYAEG